MPHKKEVSNSSKSLISTAESPGYSIVKMPCHDEEGLRNADIFFPMSHAGVVVAAARTLTQGQTLLRQAHNKSMRMVCHCA